MIKTDIARRIHHQAEISEKEAAKLLDGIFEILASTLRKGDPIIISGFGKFTVRSKLPRKGRNPSTGKAIMISARRSGDLSSERPSHHRDEFCPGRIARSSNANGIELRGCCRRGRANRMRLEVPT
jgi:nucleoid DNA-binding protein